MKDRQATPRDLPQIMNLIVYGLSDDPVYDWTWRYRRQYPWDNYYYWSLQIASMITASGMVVRVVELDESDDFRNKDDPLGTIVSFIVWKREGNRSYLKKVKDAKPRGLNLIDRTVATFRDYSASLHFPEGRRDADNRRWSIFRQGLGEISRTHFEHFAEFWELELLATHRNYRKRGAATTLIRWGTKIADEEGVACCVVSSPMGKPVYEFSGFSLVEELPWIFQLEGEVDKAECYIMVRPPKTERVKSSEGGDGYMIVETLD